MSATPISSPPLDVRQRTGTTRNPISSRLYKVLGTNYSNPALREALETVSELYSAPENAAKVPDYDKDDKRTIETAKPVASGSGTAARARKSLRRDAELKLTQASRQFLQAFQEVDKARNPMLHTFMLCSYL